MRKTNQNAMKNLFPYLIMIVVFFVVLSVLNLGRTITHEITTGELMSEIQNKNVTEITITPSSEESVYYVEGKLSDYKENEEFVIFPDLMHLKSKQNYLEIAGNKIKCGEKITKNEYQKLFNSTIKEMIEQEKLNPEMINECTSLNIATELNEIYNTNTNIRK